jgi:hypothetical protein
MAGLPNKLFRGWCSNEGNTRSRILHYQIVTIRNIKDYDGGFIPEEVKTLEEYFNLDDISTDEEPYYAIYGTFKLDVPRGPIKIFETDELRVAIFVVEQLTGNKVREDEVYN